MIDIRRKIKTAAAHAGISEAEIARRIESSPQSLSKRLKTGKFSGEELEGIAAAMGSTLRLDFVFPDGTTI